MRSRFTFIFGIALLTATFLVALLASFQAGQAGLQVSRDQQAGEIVSPTLVTIDAPLTVTVGVSATFTASVEPISTTLPVTYSWQASSGQAITHTGGLSDTLALAWEQPGQVLITVTAANTAGLVTDTHTIQIIQQANYHSYLPFISSHPPNRLNNIWVSEDGEVYMVGDSGTILNYNDNTWQYMNSQTTRRLNGVWGSASDDVFAIGDHGTILHYDGNTWSMMESGISNTPYTNTQLFGIWGSAHDDVYATGDYGTILHYDGNAWSKMESGTVLQLLGIWGSGSDDIFVVGGYADVYASYGVILHYNGSAWSQMRNYEGHFHSIWGNAHNDIFALGGEGNGTNPIQHYDGNIWSTMENNLPNTLLVDIWGTANNNTFAVGDGIWHYDGNTWHEMESGAGIDFKGIWGNTSDNIYAVSWNGILLRYDGNIWSRIE